MTTPSLFDSNALWTVAMMAPTTCRHGFVETAQVGCAQCRREAESTIDKTVH